MASAAFEAAQLIKPPARRGVSDHIRGLGGIVAACEAATFVCSAALRQDEFLTLVAAYRQRAMMTNSGVQEFSEVIRVLQARSQRQHRHVPTFATSGRCLWQRDASATGSPYASTIYALSPSDVSILFAHQHIAALLPGQGTTKLRLPVLTPNYAAVVLWVNIGEVFILLGSDLEETGHPGTGWSVLLNSSTYPQGKATVFKIPHHGSQTADQPQVWQDMLHAAPFAILTPFARGNVSLPTRQDVDRICTRTAHAYATAVPRHRRRRGRPNTVERAMREAVRSIRDVLSSTGHIRLRANLATQPLSWHIELLGDARPLRELYEV